MTKELNGEQLPFWKVNVPQEQWTDECPDFLRACSEKDKGIIGMRDEEVCAFCGLVVPMVAACRR